MKSWGGPLGRALRRDRLLLVATLVLVEKHYARLFEQEEGLTSGGGGNLVFTGDDDDPDTLETLNQMGFERPSDMSRIIRTALALALFAPLATACDTGEELDSDVRAVENFEDGMICDSDQGAFRVTLWSDSGDIEVGSNNLIVRLGMFDPNDIEGAKMQIPLGSPQTAERLGYR